MDAAEVDGRDDAESIAMADEQAELSQGNSVGCPISRRTGWCQSTVLEEGVTDHGSMC